MDLLFERAVYLHLLHPLATGLSCKPSTIVVGCSDEKFMQCSFKLQKEASALCVECCGYATELFAHSAFQEEGFSKKDKRITMAQHENGLWKDSFINRTH